MEKFCRSFTKYSRRKSRVVNIGRVAIGGDNPVAPQSMTDCSTMDTAACVEQIRRIHSAGCDIVRLTTQGRREAENLKNIREELDKAGLSDVAIVADVHFAPEVVLIAANYADKVRINPGNFGGAGERFSELLDKCAARRVALRVGVNHGSLAPHIVKKWGDTPRGMVESAMEYLRVCKKRGFDQVVVSMKSSNVRVMVYAYRMLVAEMYGEEMSYPLHLGVTEAGNGMDGRIKSATGMGALMCDGLGDTIRVSLTEPPENEIPVANAIIRYFEKRGDTPAVEATGHEAIYSPYEYNPRRSLAVGNIGGGIPLLMNELDADAREGIAAKKIAVLEADGRNIPADWRSRILNMMVAHDERPVILRHRYNESSSENLQVKAAADFGLLFIDGLADGLDIINEETSISQSEVDDIALAILQATRVRMSRTEFIACPGCGRTLFNLQDALSKIKARTSHLKGLKIGVMGCIVNGPGEMADADYGYVGEGRGKITLYKGKSPVRRSVPEEEAVMALVELIKDNGDWADPE